MANLMTLVDFNGADGELPTGGLIADANGDLFGTTQSGGENNDGTVFEVASTTGLAGPLIVLAAFNGAGGLGPTGSLIADANGDLFGTTQSGGANNDGTVFEIAKTANGYAGTPTVLASFDGATEGLGPNGSLIADANGDLFGTTSDGGADSDGTVFEIAKTAGAYASTLTVLSTFNGADGAVPTAGLTADAHGDLFGTTVDGGAGNNGTVFEIAKTANGYASTPAVLASFETTDEDPGSLILDANGDIFGAAGNGGPNSNGVDNDGTVFEIVHTANGYASTPAVLATFNGTDGDLPTGSLFADAHGNLFGNTFLGGANNDGTVFEIASTASGYASTPTVLASFNGTDGSGPNGGLIADATGDLFGTNSTGGGNAQGTVFEVTDSGVVVCYLRGTRILTPAGDVPVERLNFGDAVITRFSGIRRVKWIGRQSFAARFIRGNRDQIPVRIRAGAFGHGLPKRDLFVSPGHSMLIEDKLVLARSLVNGVTIVQDHLPRQVHYYQLEFDSHDCILAEGVWSESFCDYGGLRKQFHNAGEFWSLHPGHVTPEAHCMCAPRPQTGPALDRLLRPVVDRAAGLIALGPLQGFVDEASACGVIRGWAQDVAHPELPVLLEICAGGTMLETVLACDPRADLVAAGIGTGRAAFTFQGPRLTPKMRAGLQIRRAADGAKLPFGSPRVRRKAA